MLSVQPKSSLWKDSRLIREINDVLDLSVKGEAELWLSGTIYSPIHRALSGEMVCQSGMVTLAPLSESLVDLVLAEVEVHHLHLSHQPAAITMKGIVKSTTMPTTTHSNSILLFVSKLMISPSNVLADLIHCPVYLDDLSG